MPFPDAILDAGKLALLRDNAGYSIEMYLALMPNTEVFRCEPTADILDQVYAEIPYTNETGDFNNVKAGMTFIVSIVNNPRVVAYRGRIRADADATKLYIEESDFQLTTLATIFVYDDYDYWAKIPRVASGVYYKDWDITFRNLLPRIHGLQSSYVTVADTSASFNFAPTGTAMAAGATISSWLWNVADGTITTGTSTSKDVTVSFPEGSRWVKVTVTDSNTNSHTFIFVVHVVPTDYHSVVKLDIQDVRITGTIEDGWNAQVGAWAGFEAILDKTHATIFAVEHYANGEPFAPNIAFVGRMRQNQALTRGDASYAQLQDAIINLEGPLAIISRLRGATFTIFTVFATPTRWDQIQDATPGRAMWYLLTEHSTIANLHSVSFIGDTEDTTDDNDLNYISDDLNVADTSIRDSLDQMAYVYNAAAIFAAAGELVLYRDYNFLSSTNKQNAVVVGGVRAVEDTEQFSVDVDPDDNIGRAIVGAGMFTTAIRETTAYIAAAPSQGLGRGQGREAVNAQVLPHNIPIPTGAQIARLRAAAVYGIMQPRDVVSATMWLAWWFMQPALHQRWAWVIPPTSNARGVWYESGWLSNAWLLRSVELSYDAELGTVVVNGEWQVAAIVGIAGTEVAIAPGNVDYTLPVMPIVPPYAFLPPNAEINLPPDFDPINDIPPYDGTDGNYVEPIPTPDIDETAQPGADCWTGNVFFKDNSNIATPWTSELGETYTVTVEGTGTINSGGTLEWDFSLNDGGWQPDPVAGVNYGTYVSGQYWDATDAFTTQGNVFNRQLNLVRTFGATYTLTQVVITVDYVLGTYNNTSVVALAIRTIPSVTLLSYTAATVPTPILGDETWNGSVDADQFIVTLRSSRRDSALYDGRARLLRVSATLASVSPVPVDAFYQTIDTTPELHPSGQGFRIDNAAVSPVPPFSPNNKYSFTFTGTGNPILLRFASPTPELNANTALLVTICGPNAGGVT